MTVPYVEDAERLLRGRQARRGVFGVVADGFGEPAWDILLRLYVEEARGRTVRSIDLVDCALDGLDIVETYLKFLASHRTVRFEGEGTDQRAALTDHGRDLMARYFQSRGEP